MLQLSKEKQFTWEKAAKAQKVENIQEQEKPLIKVSMEISTNLETYSEPSWVSMMDLSTKIFNGGRVSRALTEATV